VTNRCVINVRMRTVLLGFSLGRSRSFRMRRANFVSPTPKAVPGARTITTMELEERVEVEPRLSPSASPGTEQQSDCRLIRTIGIEARYVLPRENRS
jgi:hypothetical protein